MAAFLFTDLWPTYSGWFYYLTILMDNSSKILLIDGRPHKATHLRQLLAGHDYRVVHARTGAEGLKITYDQHPDLVLLSTRSGVDLDSERVCSQLDRFTSIPILAVAPADDQVKVSTWFNHGADDFIREPLDYDELVCRIHNLKERTGDQVMGRDPSGTVIYQDDHLTIDPKNNQININGQKVHLTPKENALLAALVRKPGRIFSTQELMELIWPDKESPSKTIISLYIYYLRNKVETGQEEHQYIRTEWGEGYWFCNR